MSQTDSLSVRVDSAEHEVVLSVRFHAGKRIHAHYHGAGDHESMAVFGWSKFSWPVDGWVRGFRLKVLRCNQPFVTHSVLHHLIVANLARRQLVHPAMERLLAVGSETPDVVLPKTVGIPISLGTPLAIRIGWSPHSDARCDITFRLAILWIPKNLVPAPTEVLPFYVDVQQQDVLASNVFDVTPGLSTQTLDFTLPVSGRLLAVGAHLHRYGQQISLIALLLNDTLSKLRAHADSVTEVPSIERKLYGVWGRGLRLKAGHRYRVASEYLNPTDTTLRSAGMAHFVGLFAPDASPPSLAQEFSSTDLVEDYRRVCGRSYPACTPVHSTPRPGR
jgi:hypothetical protein